MRLSTIVFFPQQNQLRVKLVGTGITLKISGKLEQCVLCYRIQRGVGTYLGKVNNW